MEITVWRTAGTPRRSYRNQALAPAGGIQMVIGVSAITDSIVELGDWGAACLIERAQFLNDA